MTFTNFTNITAANTTLELIQSINIELGGAGMFILLTVIAFFVILWLNYDAGSAKDTFLITSFLTGTLTSFLWLAGLAPLYLAVVTWILMLFAVVISFMVN